MPEPLTTTLSDLAKEIGATSEEINQLSPGVQQLTKGKLLALWGVKNELQAIAAYQGSHQGAQIPSPSVVAAVADAPLELTLQDVSSIQKVFTADRVQATLGSAEAARLAALASADPSAADVEVAFACCCTPCCCSASLLENTEAVT